MEHPYKDISIAYATKHKKHLLIEKQLRSSFNAKVFCADVDTDLLGTFSGEIARALTPLDTALAKVRWGMKESGIPYGIASEGSIGLDPFLPFMNVDYEILVFVDNINNLLIEVSEKFLDIVAVKVLIKERINLDEFLVKADFPRHKLIVRENNENNNQNCIKGIDDFKSLNHAIDKLLASSPNSEVIVESDFRSMSSPTRQQNIRKLSEKLVQRMRSLCTECGSPGWGKVAFLRGLACRACSVYDETAFRAKVLCCVSCEYQKTQKPILNFLEPANCQFCNP